MIDFNKYFNDEYQFALKKATYTWLEHSNQGTELELNIGDKISASIMNNNLEVTFDREVYFEPEALYAICISLSFTLSFRDGQLTEDAKKINWSEVLVENENPYLSNVISRASYLIATLTSSYGQQPLVTPPNFIR